MNKILFKKEIKSNYNMLILFMAILSMYCYMIIAMFEPGMVNSIKTMIESMPDLFAAFGMAQINDTLIEFVGGYLYGFILIAFPLVFIILLTNKLVVRYVDRGSMAYLLATPNKRKNIIRTQGIFMALSILCLVVYVTIFSIIVSQSMFPGELNMDKFLILNVGLYGLLLFMGGLNFLSACVFNESSFALGVGGGLSVLFILIQMISQVGEKFEVLKYLTPLTLFNPDKIIAGDTSADLEVIILYLVGVIFFIVGFKIFSKKDLHL